MIEAKRVKQFKRFALISTLVLIASSIPFSFYVLRQYRALEEEFLSVRETIPTRFFSDVKILRPSLPRNRVEKILKRLLYASSTQGPSALVFRLRPVTYPVNLLPEGHPTLRMQNQEIRLEFNSGGDGKQSLQKILGPGPDGTLANAPEELPELALEPEQIATFAPGNSKVRGLLAFEDIPASVWKAILSVEDQHFLEHSGVDPRGMARAIFVNLRTLSLSQGGSTITQQLVKNLLSRRTKNVVRKFSEIFLALFLEVRFPKETILERYLNEVYLGQIGPFEVRGVAEGAKYFFGKSIQELRLSEIALLAGVIRGTGYYSPYRFPERAIARRNLVLDKMAETNQIAPEEAAEAKLDPLRLAPPPEAANRMGFFTDFARAQLEKELAGKFPEEYLAEAGFRVFTTLDVDLQEDSETAMNAHLKLLEEKRKIPADTPLEGTLIAVDPKTGNVLCVLGGRNYARSSFNRAIHMRRQAGSTFKPVVLLAALETGSDPDGVPYGPSYPLLDAPWTLSYDQGRQKWSPKNYEKTFRGWVTLRIALADSINIPFAKLANQVGEAKIIEVAKRLGLEGPITDVPSLALGSAEVTVAELARAYSVFANHGVRPELSAIRTVTYDDGGSFASFVPRHESVVDAKIADWVRDFLRSPFEIGTARPARTLGFTAPAFGKTGTTNDFRDAWFAGFPPEGPVIVTWVGFDRTSINPKKTQVPLTGAEAAIPIWVAAETSALEGKTVVEPDWHESLDEIKMDLKSGLRASLSCEGSQVVLDRYAKNRLPENASCAATYPENRGNP